MKNLLVFFLFLLMISCGKNEVENNLVNDDSHKIAPYDTVAIDSFSQGAISLDVARKIKMSSLAYRDSLKTVKKKLEADQLAQKEKEESEKATKKAAEELKKTEAFNAKKLKDAATPETSPVDHVTKP